MIEAVYGKTMENVRKQRIIKIVNNNKKRNKLVSEPNYHTTKYFSESLLAIEMKKTSVKMNKPIYFGLSILSISKTFMYKYWYDEVKIKYEKKIRLCYMNTDGFKIKYEKKIRLCYMNTDGFIMHIKTEDFYKDIADDFFQ